MVFLSKIFKKKEQLVPLSLSFLQTDIHSHLIPGIDDGSVSVDDSINLINGLIGLGYKSAITTPHVMSDFYRNTPDIIKTGFNNLVESLKNKGIDFNLSFAAEYYLDFDFFKNNCDNELLTFGNNYVLVEFSFMEACRNYKEIFFELQTCGYKIVLAHPERYLYWHQNLHLYSGLKDRDINFQINLLSLGGYYGLGSQHVAEWLLLNNYVEFLGTDLHNNNHVTLLKSLSVKQSIANKIAGTHFLNSGL